MQTADKVREALKALAPTAEKVRLAVRTAVEVAEPSRVILFGSGTRGDARWDSDLDLAVVMPDSAESRLGTIRRDLRRRLDQVPMSIDLVLTTEGMVSQFRSSINSIYCRIVNEGKVAYERRPAQAGATAP